MATSNELYNQLNDLWESFQENHRAHSEKGNKAAGGRARKASIENQIDTIINLIQLED
jgi:hypothetical protein